MHTFNAIATAVLLKACCDNTRVTMPQASAKLYRVSAERHDQGIQSSNMCTWGQGCQSNGKPSKNIDIQCIDMAARLLLPGTGACNET